MLKLYLVPVEDVDFYWEQVSGFIDSALALAGGEATLADILLMIQQRELDLWIAWDNAELKCVAACTTMIQSYPRFKSCTIVHFGGTTIKAVDQLLPKIQQWAKQQGCKKIRVYGRKAWVKHLTNHGFNYRFTCVEAEI